MIQHPLPNGTIVRVNGYSRLVEVEDYVSEPPNTKGFYYLNSPSGFNDVIRAEGDIIEVVATAEEASASRLPSKRQVHRLLALLCGEESEDFSIYETEIEDNAVSLYGENELGQRFAIVVRVSAVLPVDF